MNETFTIVTPSYNQGQYIEKTIESVLSQAGDFYIEYIISDNSSTDQSLDIIKKYERLIKTGQYPVKCKGLTYHYWLRKNRGQTYGLNKSFVLGTGDIFAWINSDDYYEPGALQFIANQFQKYPAASLIYGHCHVHYENQNRVKLLKSEFGTFEKFLRRNHTVCQPASFFTRKIFERVGGINDRYQYAFDYDLWLKILKVGRAVCVDKVLSNFRVWSESKTFSKQEKFMADRKEIFKHHGGNVIDPKTIYSLRARIPFIKTIRSRFPKSYNYLKKAIYFFIDKFRYHPKIKRKS